MKKSLRSLLTLLLLAVASVAVAEKLPADATLITPDGKEFSAAKLSNSGKPMLISLWATWCRPCINELTAVNARLADWQKETGVKLVAINVEGLEKKEAVEAVMKEKGWKGFELLFEKDRSMSKAFQVRGIPFMIYVDGQGNVLDTTTGFDPEAGADHIIEHLNELLAK